MWWLFKLRSRLISAWINQSLESVSKWDKKKKHMTWICLTAKYNTVWQDEHRCHWSDQDKSKLTLGYVFYRFSSANCCVLIGTTTLVRYCFLRVDKVKKKRHDLSLFPSFPSRWTNLFPQTKETQRLKITFVNVIVVVVCLRLLVLWWTDIVSRVYLISTGMAFVFNQGKQLKTGRCWVTGPSSHSNTLLYCDAKKVRWRKSSDLTVIQWFSKWGAEPSSGAICPIVWTDCTDFKFDFPCSST